MKIIVCGTKGGIAKSTTALHLAAVLNQQAPTLLIDSDRRQTAASCFALGKIMQAQGGAGLGFEVIDAELLFTIDYQKFSHHVIDTQGGIELRDAEKLAAQAKGGVVILPTTPDMDALRQLQLMVNSLRQVGVQNYRALLTIVPPPPDRMGPLARSFLSQREVPAFRAQVPRLNAFPTALGMGTTAQNSGSKNAARAWEAYVQVVQEIQEWLNLT